MKSYNHRRVPVKNLPNLRPYFRMFGTILSMLTDIDCTQFASSHVVLMPVACRATTISRPM